MNELKAFLDARSAAFGTLQNLAGLMRVTFSGFLRGVKSGTLSPENCLRLAEVLGEQPSVVFRVARKLELADQFDRLYGQTANPMTEAERELVDVWRELTPRAREGLWLVIRDLHFRSDAIPHTGVSGSHTKPVPAGRSSGQRDGRALAEVEPPAQSDPVPRASPTAREQTLTAFKQATRDIEAADLKKARRHPAAPRVRATGSGARVRKPRR